MTKSHTTHTCLTPRRRFGQNFLTDPHVIQSIIECINPHPEHHIVEIGPGKGALTEHLASCVWRLDAVELDRDLIPILLARCPHAGNLHVHQQDILQFDLQCLAEQSDRPLRVIGNLPYNISTPVLFHCLQVADYIEDMVFMLQKEVAQRICAGVSTRAYGRLSVMMQYHCQATLLLHVPARAFFPKPAVISTLIHLRPYATKPHLAHNYDHFSQLVRDAFAKRRKTIANSLKAYLTREELAAMGCCPSRRAETLTVADFVRLSNGICSNREQDSVR